MDTFLSGVHVGLILGVWGLLLVGCQGKGRPPDVDEGAFTAHIQGTVSDTVTGTAHYKTTEGTLHAFELGQRDGSGLSIELEPHPLGLRTYEVVDPEIFGVDRDGQAPGVMAFLALGNGRFTAVDGTLTLTYVDEEQVGAEFSFLMEGDFEDAPADNPSVKVTGVLNTFPEP